MEDRFKFKAYWKDTKKEIKDFMEEYSLSHLHDEDIKVVQCTGLKDKNGKLIYEGDIIHKISQQGEGYMGGVGLSIKHIIVFGKANPDWNTLTDFLGFWAVPIFSYTRGEIEESAGSIKYLTDIEGKNPSVVIGNIHENKELLND